MCIGLDAPELVVVTQIRCKNLTTKSENIYISLINTLECTNALVRVFPAQSNHAWVENSNAVDPSASGINAVLPVHGD